MNLIRIAKQCLKFVIYIFLFLVITFAICEIWFRTHPDPPPAKYYRDIINTRLWNEWLNEKNTDLFFPPFKIIANKKFDDIERLRFILKETSLPRNTTFRSHDFLRPEELKEKTSYTVTINNLGFRDPPRTIQKPPHVFRIIVLGCYSAFGHAVNDEDTYPRQLEHILNNSGFSNIHFEVWNGGRQSASAIWGWARLKLELLQYNPDLIIWDYGFVDPGISGDDDFPVAYIHPNTGISRPLVWLFHLIRNNSSLYLLTIRKFEEYLIAKCARTNTKAFFEVNQRMMEFTANNDIPVILMRQTLVRFPPSAEYQKFANKYDNVIFVDGKKIFRKYPPSPEMIKKFHSQENWLSEYQPGLEKIRYWHPPEYFKDIFQYNEWGYKAIAEYLADTIKTDFPRFLSIRRGQNPADNSAAYPISGSAHKIDS